jgi:adenylate kinase
MNNSPKIIILLGPPGAGKGTQAIMVAKNLRIPHISTGEIMRKAVADQTDLGKKVKSYLDTGHLVPDDLVVDLIKDRISNSDCSPGFLLDGFPRTMEQGSALDNILKAMNLKTTAVIDIAVPDQVLIDRIAKRGQDGSGRSDDNAEMAAKRLGVYKAQTAPLTKYYDSTSGVKHIDGLGTVEEVNKRILAAI